MAEGMKDESACPLAALFILPPSTFALALLRRFFAVKIVLILDAYASNNHRPN